MGGPKVVAAALVEKDGKYLLVKEVLESGREHWIIPGGKVEFGETIEEAVRREIKEETNLDVEISRFLCFKEAVHTKYNYHTVIFFFLAKPMNEKITTDSAIKEWRFFSVEEALKLDNLVDSARNLLEDTQIKI